MANSTLGFEPMSVTVLRKHRIALDGYATEYGYPGRSATLRRLLDIHPELQNYFEEQEEPTPCPSPP